MADALSLVTSGMIFSIVSKAHQLGTYIFTSVMLKMTPRIELQSIANVNSMSSA